MIVDGAARCREDRTPSGHLNQFILNMKGQTEEERTTLNLPTWIQLCWTWTCHRAATDDTIAVTFCFHSPFSSIFSFFYSHVRLQILSDLYCEKKRSLSAVFQSWLDSSSLRATFWVNSYIIYRDPWHSIQHIHNIQETRLIFSYQKQLVTQTDVIFLSFWVVPLSFKHSFSWQKHSFIHSSPC